jgi:hypothetical protein
MLNYTISHSLIYGKFFGNIATKIYLYDLVFVPAFNSQHKVGWIAAFIEDFS